MFEKIKIVSMANRHLEKIGGFRCKLCKNKRSTVVDRLFLEKCNSADVMKNLKVEKNKSRNTQLHFATKIIEIHPETKEYDPIEVCSILNSGHYKFPNG